MVMVTCKTLLLVRILNIVTNMLCAIMMNYDFNTFFLLNLLGYFIDYLCIWSLGFFIPNLVYRYH